MLGKGIRGHAPRSHGVALGEADGIAGPVLWGFGFRVEGVWDLGFRV